MTEPQQPAASPPRPTPGAIEFRCPQCHKLLRVPSDAAGRQAQCPDCKAVMRVPLSSVTSAVPVELPIDEAGPLAGEDGAAAESDRAAGQRPAAPTAAGGALPRAPLAPPVRHSPPANPAAPGAAVSHAASPLGSAAWHTAAEASSVSPVKRLFDRITTEIRKVFLGQDELVLGTLVALFSSGHVLIESVPGLGKTLFVRTLGRVLGCRFGRIQFTADLMPSDITGAPIFDMKTQEFRFHPGPVFTQLLLADEINRSPAKTHAALLEIMQEYRVTIERTSHKLARPFLVLATQNPIESEGTYNLPEAQLDRFMFKIVVDYPSAEEEAEVLKMHSRQQDIDQRLADELETVTSPEEIVAMTRRCAEVTVDDRLVNYINTLVRLTRQWPQFHMGASPRAGLALMQGARTLAAFYGRDYAVPDDVVQIAIAAMRHRVILTAESEVEGHRVDDLLRELIRSVEVPRL
jgi:MoxR-like ATPase